MLVMKCYELNFHYQYLKPQGLFAIWLIKDTLLLAMHYIFVHGYSWRLMSRQ